MLCEEILKQVLEIARYYVRSGRVTERRLARNAGLSQPHLHNALKGIRKLSPDSADKILKSLDLTVPDILWWSPGDAEPGTRAIPMLRDRIGPGSQGNFGQYRGYLALPKSMVDRLQEPLAARLAPDPAMPAALRANDLVLLDRNPEERMSPALGCCWVVEETAGLRVRYLQLTKAGLASGVEPIAGGEPEWRRLGTGPQNLRELVRAKIVWNGREMEAQARPAGPPGGRN